MKNISIFVFALLSISLSALSHATQHGAADAAHGAKCEGMSNASFGIGHLDSDKDGNISLQEYLAGGGANAEKTFKHLDANGDGKLDAEEQREIEAVYKNIHDQYKAKKD